MANIKLMNKTVKKAYTFLLKKYDKKDISFNTRMPYKFLTSDGKRWEVKRLYGNKILLSKKHFDYLCNNETIILVFSDDKDYPVLKINSLELNKRRVFNGIGVHVWENKKVEDDDR